MIENELRAVFERREDLVPSSVRLVEKINEGARQRRRRRRLAQSGVAVAVAVGMIATLPAVTRRFLATAPVPTGSSAPTSTAMPPVPLAGRPVNLLVAIAAPDKKGVVWNTLGIVHVSADRRGITIVALPRQAQVDVPGHGKQELGDAYDAGGFDRLDAALAPVSGLTFDGTVKIDVPKAIKAVDAVGGMQLCYGPREYHRVRYGRPWPFPSGCRTVSGEDAMTYISYYGGGAQYMLPQSLNFAAALLRNLIGRGGLSDPDTFTTFAGAFGSAVSVDLRGHRAEEFRELIPPTADLTAVKVPLGAAKPRERDDKEPPREFVLPASVVTPLFAALREDRAWNSTHVRPIDGDPLRELFPGDGDWPPGTEHE